MTPSLPEPKYQFTPGWSDFTADWWTRRIPQWDEFVKPMTQAIQGPVKILEVGSYEGRSALYMLNNLLNGHEKSRLTCIDIWFKSDFEQRFDLNIACSGHSHKVTKIKGDAFAALRVLSLDSNFDVVYIDADHIARSALTQAAMCWPLMKIGGILVFDDYPWKSPTPTEDLPPGPGIDAFLDLWKGRYKLLHKGWQVMLLKLR
jgi:predicted O-methyltransferase YrrM